MTLEQAVQERWAADATLPSLVAAERVFTAAVPPEMSPPYVVVRRGSARPAVGAAGGNRAERVEMTFEATLADYDAAAELSAALDACFDDASFDAGEGHVVLLRKADESRRATPHGPAVVVTTFIAVLWKS